MQDKRPYKHRTACSLGKLKHSHMHSRETKRCRPAWRRRSPAAGELVPAAALEAESDTLGEEAAALAGGAVRSASVLA